MENEILTESEPQTEFSDVEIKYLAESHEKKQKKIDDIIAFQAVLCILTVIAFFIANQFIPDTCHELYKMLQTYITDTNEIISNPIDSIT